MKGIDSGDWVVLYLVRSHKTKKVRRVSIKVKANCVEDAIEKANWEAPSYVDGFSAWIVNVSNPMAIINYMRRKPEDMEPIF